MRSLLLASAALIIAAPAMAGKSVDFNITSALGKSCSIAATDTNLTVGPLASATDSSSFDTTCNFEISDLTLTFTSANGGVLNSVEGVTETYTVTFGADTIGSTAAQSGVALSLPSGLLANYPINRPFSVALDQDLSIAGDYADVLTVEVAP